MRSRRLRLLVLALLAPLAVWLALPMLSSGQSAEELQQRIDETRSELEGEREQAGVLSTTIAGYTDRINTLQAEITELQRRQDVLQADLDVKRARLARVQAELRRQRARVARLKAQLAHSQEVLAVRLVEIYKAGEPDLVSVIFSSNGFADLLERGEFMRRINDQDRRVITRVREDKERATLAAERLDELENRQQRITAEVLADRNEVARVREDLDSSRGQYAEVRGAKQSALDATHDNIINLEGDLRVFEREQARIQGILIEAGAQFDSGSAGPIRQGSGSFIWPVDGPVTSPFGWRWGRMHEGIDIGVPSGTGIRAADSGTVALAAWTGGYGNYTCIQHTASLSTCYAHQSSYAVGVGESVSQGQVIGYVGCTGNCFGDHLHFEVRVNGGAVDPMGYL